MQQATSLMLVVLALLLIKLSEAGKINCILTTPYKKNIRFHLSNDELLVNTLYDGVNLVIDKHDPYISYVISQIGTWEPDSIQMMARFVKPGDTIVNLGTHIGIELVVLGQIAGPTGRLYGVEPGFVNFRILQKNIFINKLHNITMLYNMAVSDREEKGFLFVDLNNTGCNEVYTEETIKERGIDNIFNENIRIEPIKINKVDNILPKDLKVDFILMDVQLLEVETLDGMRELIARSTDLIIYTEWVAISIKLPKKEYDIRLRNLLTWLVEHKFKFYKMGFVDGFRSSGGACEKAPLIEMSMKELIDFGNYLNSKKNFVDIIIASGHIDLNKYE